jgi:hypothetical protein
MRQKKNAILWNPKNETKLKKGHAKMDHNGKLEARNLISDGITALAPANLNLCGNYKFFSTHMQITNHGHIEPNTVVDKTGQKWKTTVT